MLPRDFSGEKNWMLPRLLPLLLARDFFGRKNWMLPRDFFLLKKIEMFFFIFIISSAAALQRTQQWHNSPRIDRLTVEIPWKTE